MYNKKLFWIITSVFLVLALALLSFLVFLKNEQNVTIVTRIVQSLIIFVTGYGVFFTVYTTISQLGLSKEEKVQEKNHKKKEEAFKLILKWDAPELLKARAYSREIKKTREVISSAQLIEDINLDPERQASIIILFNYAEILKVAIKHDLVDKAIIGYVCYALKDILDRFDPYRLHMLTSSENQEDEKRDYSVTKKMLDDCIDAYGSDLRKKS